MLAHARLSATPASHRSVHHLKASSRLLEHHALEYILQTHLPSHRIADLATIKTQAVSFLGYFYNAITFSTFPTRSNLRPLVIQGVTILLSSSRQTLKQNALTSVPISQSFAHVDQRVRQLPLPPLLSNIRVQDLRAATSRPANARRRLLHRFLGRATQQPTETPSATVRASTIKILNLPLLDPIG